MLLIHSDIPAWDYEHFKWFIFCFWTKTLHVSDSTSVHMQQFFTVHTANLYDINQCCVYSEKLMMGQRNCPKLSKNKYEKLMYLVGFILRIYHNARSPERQTGLFSISPTLYADRLSFPCLGLFHVTRICIYIHTKIYGCMFCILLFNSRSYVFLLLCMFCSVYSVFIVPNGTLRATLTEVYPCFSFICKANARV